MSLMCTKPRMWSSEPSINGDARTLRGGEHSHRFFQARFHRQRVHVRPRHHHFAHLHLAKLHRVLNESALRAGEQRPGPAPAASSPAILRRSAPRVWLCGATTPSSPTIFSDGAVEQIDRPAKRSRNQWKGRAISSATRSARARLRLFGTSSPKTTCRNVSRPKKQRPAQSPWARSVPKARGNACQVGCTTPPA